MFRNLSHQNTQYNRKKFLKLTEIALDQPQSLKPMLLNKVLIYYLTDQIFLSAVIDNFIVISLKFDCYIYSYNKKIEK